MAGRNTALLVVAGGVTGELEDLGAQVLKDSCHVDGAPPPTRDAVATFLQVAGHTADRELKPSLGRARGALPLLLSASSFSFSRHDVKVCKVSMVWGNRITKLAVSVPARKAVFKEKGWHQVAWRAVLLRNAGGTAWLSARAQVRSTSSVGRARRLRAERHASRRGGVSVRRGWCSCGGLTFNEI